MDDHNIIVPNKDANTSIAGLPKSSSAPRFSWLKHFAHQKWKMEEQQWEASMAGRNWRNHHHHEGSNINDDEKNNMNNRMAIIVINVENQENKKKNKCCWCIGTLATIIIVG